MRSSSPLLSYQQVLDTRQCALAEREVMALLHQLLVEIAKLHAAGQIHGNLSLENLWRDVEGELYMYPAAQFRDGWTARDDVRSIAQIAISLLTNHPFHPDWQETHDSPPLRKPLIQVLAAAVNFTAEIPLRDASDLLQALHRIHSLQLALVPEAPPPPPPAPSTWRKLLQLPGRLLQFIGAIGRLILKLVLLAGLLGTAGWMAYEHFIDLLSNQPRSIPVSKPSVTPSVTPSAANPSSAPSPSPNNPPLSIPLP